MNKQKSKKKVKGSIPRPKKRPAGKIGTATILLYSVRNGPEHKPILMERGESFIHHASENGSGHMLPFTFDLFVSDFCLDFFRSAQYSNAYIAMIGQTCHFVIHMGVPKILHVFSFQEILWVFQEQKCLRLVGAGSERNCPGGENNDI